MATILERPTTDRLIFPDDIDVRDGDELRPAIESESIDQTVERLLQEFELENGPIDLGRTLDFAHFRRRKRGNPPIGGTERWGVLAYRGRWATGGNPPTPATGGGAPGRWLSTKVGDGLSYQAPLYAGSWGGVLAARPRAVSGARKPFTGSSAAIPSFITAASTSAAWSKVPTFMDRRQRADVLGNRV